MADDYVCDRCGRRFASNRELQEHREVVHGSAIRAALGTARRALKGLFRM
jgi:hypothetical protein